MKWLLQKYSEDDIRQILEKDDLIGQTWGTLHSAVSVLVCIVPSNFFFLFSPCDKYLKWRWCIHFYHSLSVVCSAFFLGGGGGGGIYSTVFHWSTSSNKEEVKHYRLDISLKDTWLAESQLDTVFVLFCFLPSTSLWGVYSKTFIHRYCIPLTNAFTRLCMSFFSHVHPALCLFPFGYSVHNFSFLSFELIFKYHGQWKEGVS